MLRTFGVLLLLALGAGAGWLGRAWFSGAPTADKETALRCRVARGRLEQNIKATVGYIKPAPHALVRLGFAAGKDLARPITRLTLQEGDFVSPGALLAELDHEDLKLTHAQ